MVKKVMDENEHQGREKTEKARSDNQPVMTVNLYSWAVPLVGVVMLVIGLLGGYFLRPLVASETRPSSVVESAGPTGQATAPASPNTAQVQAPSQDALQVMEMLTGETKHFIGDADAPVVMIEFSDFQ